MLIAGALGVNQTFYAAFASWLARRGHLVMTFDLRGMGASLQPQHRLSLRGLDVDMLGWARLDFAAAVRHLLALDGGAQIGVTGHSLGMHHWAMTDAATQACISKVVSVAAGADSWRDWMPRTRGSARFTVTAFSFTDDDAISLMCTQTLLAVLPNAPSQLCVVSPLDIGLARIGHVGAFRRAGEAALWPMLEQPLLE